MEFDAFHHLLRMKKARYLKKWMYESSVRDRPKQHRLLLCPLVNSLFLSKTGDGAACLRTAEGEEGRGGGEERR
ncbi:unnamed protein product [Musa acuminata subsp. malaccensis]|uniref:(wild Malaysian banana) hypothetical protein n=1 Tax=Musa acuminata subsp. malaccensis TaxID=214687 RepID=A0A804J3U1_MUSAM|nr:unnamed protein product [Musa acuminata subsp. malaccensis]